MVKSSYKEPLENNVVLWRIDIKKEVAHDFRKYKG
jgi:hypothetical protein